MAAYTDSVFAATHNSYSPHRGSLAAQLASGVRFLELDVHLDDARYRLGHATPGHQVAQGDGNPDDDALAHWLATIASWSDEHAEHAPITLALDVKSDLTKPNSFAEGNPAALNAVLRDAFGERLLSAEQLGGEDWPALEELHGRVVWVLSGNGTTRRGYRVDGGRDPVVALGDGGAAVEVHASRAGDLWYWTGVHGGERVSWKRHGRIGTGREPAVALTDDGIVVLVHGGGPYDVSCRVGRLAGGEIAWGAARRAALPKARGEAAPALVLLAENTLRATYETGYGRRACTGELADGEDGPRSEVRWSETAENATGADAQFHRDHAVRGQRVVSVAAVPRADGDGEVLVYGTERVASAPIHYEQLAFVEAQWLPPVGPKEKVGEDQRFVATKAAGDPYERWAREWREQGRLVRLWEFGENRRGSTVNPNFPATDRPDDAWYRSYLQQKGWVS
jgi:hypothetical protein